MATEELPTTQLSGVGGPGEGGFPPGKLSFQGAKNIEHANVWRPRAAPFYGANNRNRRRGGALHGSRGARLDAGSSPIINYKYNNAERYHHEPASKQPAA
jgi:hypothetical protein